MMWITWRRYRVRIVMLALYALALVILMFFTEYSYHSALSACRHVVVNHPICETQLNVFGGFAFGGVFHPLTRAASRANDLLPFLWLLPLLIGLMLGTPLIATELETKTNRLAWSQGVTRTRWFLVSWLTVLIPAVLIMSTVALFAQWWATNLTESTFVGGGLSQSIPFMISGIDPIAFAVLALSFGACVGILFRRFVSPYAITFFGLAILVGTLASRYHPAHLSQYWVHQWVIAGLYIALSAIFLALAVLRVRRWRA